MAAIHVVHFTYAVSEGGAAKGIVNLCNGLDPERFRASIITLTPPGGFERLLDRDRVAVYRMKDKRGKDLGQPWRLARLLRKLAPDVLHTHAWGTLFAGVVGGKLARVPAIVHGEHGTFDLRPSRRWLQYGLWRWSDQLLSVSQSLRDNLADTTGFPRERIRVVANGVDTERFRSRPECRRHFRDELGAADDDVVLGTVGRLHRIKGHECAIRAMTSLHERVKLWVVGDGELMQELRELADGLGLSPRVRFLGHRDDAPEILSAMDVMCQPSLSEGMSNTILEAMATQLPVVATRVGGNPELVVDGETGFVVDTDSPEALARAVGQLDGRHDARRRMGMAGYARVLETYSMPRMIGGYEAVYTELVSRVRGAP